MTPRSSGKSRARTSNPGAPSLPPLPEDADLGKYLSFQEVLRRIPISDKTLLRWATEGHRGCPPVYELGDKTRVMHAAATEEWIQSNRLWGRGESDARSA